MKSFIPSEKEKTVFQIMNWLYTHQYWGQGITIYANGKSFSDNPRTNAVTANTPKGIWYYITESQRPSDYIEGSDDTTITVVFDGTRLSYNAEQLMFYMNQRLQKYGLKTLRIWPWAVTVG